MQGLWTPGLAHQADLAFEAQLYWVESYRARAQREGWPGTVVGAYNRKITALTSFQRAASSGPGRDEAAINAAGDMVVKILGRTQALLAEHGGPFLFGKVFTDADAVLAPVLALLDAHLPDMLRLHNSIYEGLHKHGPLLDDYIAQLKETRAAGIGAFVPVASPGRHLRHVLYDTLPILVRKNLKRLILMGLALVYLVLSFMGVFRSGVSQRAVQEFKDNLRAHGIAVE